MSIVNTGINALMAGLVSSPDKTASAPASAAKPETSFSDAMTAVEKFMKYQDMTPAEKFRASYLAEKALTEEDLAKLDAETRSKIEAEIARRIREKIAQSVTS